MAAGFAWRPACQSSWSRCRPRSIRFFFQSFFFRKFSKCLQLQRRTLNFFSSAMRRVLGAMGQSRPSRLPFAAAVGAGDSRCVCRPRAHSPAPFSMSTAIAGLVSVAARRPGLLRCRLRRVRPSEADVLSIMTGNGRFYQFFFFFFFPKFDFRRTLNFFLLSSAMRRFLGAMGQSRPSHLPFAAAVGAGDSRCLRR